MTQTVFLSSVRMLPNIMHLLILVKFWCFFILAILKTNPFSLHLYK